MSDSPPSAPAARHILIVDDDREIADSVRAALQMRGFQVSVARDGNEGIALAEHIQPDLMVLDMMMPKRSGFLVLEHLRRTQPRTIPTIMVTGNEGQRHRSYAELLGVDEYFHKPFAMDRLLEAVERLLAAEPRSGEAPPVSEPSGAESGQEPNA
jgi:DNA-binding response OmpR family regulator